MKELKGFERITLQPGENRSIAFEIAPPLLAFWNIETNRVVEPGEFSILVGPSSADLREVTLTVTPGSPREA